MKPTTAPLAEVARHVIAPAGIVSTEWPSVRATCATMGLGFDTWQDDLGKLICAKRPDGLFAADVTALSIPRQTGKTYLLGALVFALCIKKPGLTAIWTAHRTRTAAETFKSMMALAKSEKVDPHIDQIIQGNGKEEVRFENGSRILFGARERGFGRGFAGVDVLIFDEAQILSENAMDDMVPATNAAPNPLIILAGTPPKPTDPGEVFTGFRNDAINGEVDDIAYVEISADPDAKPDDRSQYRRMNPSYPHRTNLRAILRMRKVLSEDSFRREAMGIWDEFNGHQAVVKESRWNELEDPGPDPADASRPDCLGVDMSHGLEISVGAAWKMVVAADDGVVDDGHHIEEVWAGSDEPTAIDWIVARAGRRIPVLIDDASPAAALAPKLKARKVRVKLTGPSHMAKGCGLFENGIKHDELTHGGQERTREALFGRKDKTGGGARKRPIRDAGGWGWDRRDPTSIIHPLVSQTLALLGAAEGIGARSGEANFA